MNQSDAERIRAVLEGMGYQVAAEEGQADVLGIVACSVRQKAIDKVYTKIHTWNRWKNSRNVLTFASGCILPADREKLLKRFDLLFTMQELPRLPDMIRQYGVVTPFASAPNSAVPETSHNDPAMGYWHVAPNYSSNFEAFVPIQNGCDKFCSFCAVPYTRGREVSRPSREVLEEVSMLVERGYKSITLLGQNVNSYGLDRRKSEISFAELLKEIGEIGERSRRRFWVYFTSPHPRDMSEDIFKIIAQYRCLANHIHLPIQSGDDKVLIRMNRNYRSDQYRILVKRFRQILPQATLFTDIIVGFSGETVEQFENTREAMREFCYNMAYIAIYSPRSGAASARWEDDVPIDEKKRRLQELSRELASSSLEYNRRMVGKTARMLVVDRDRKEGFLSARTEGRLIVRFPSNNLSLIGKFVDVRIEAANALSMEGIFEKAVALI